MAALSLVLLLAGCGKNVAEPQVVGVGACTEGCEAIPPTTRVARLTTLQWEQTVQDLLHLGGPTGLSDAFIGDPLSEGFDNNGAHLDVGAELWVDYQRAAEALAERVVAEADLYAAVVPHDPRTGGGGVDWGETVEAEDPSVTATTGAPGGSDYNLWSTGELSAAFDVPQDGTYLLRTLVWADQAGGELARATLGVDNVDELTVDVGAVSSSNAEVLEVAVELTAGPHTVHVGFLNDYYDSYTGEDRNLHIDWLAVEGQVSTLGESTAGPAEARAWITDLGMRAHRRPLTQAEIDGYAALFDLGPDLVGSGDDFADGVQLVVTAMLQSPWFLYRVEDSAEALEDGRIPLSDWEIASKLSYALWNTMPDDTLFAAAEAGELSTTEQIREQARRMLDDERARDTVLDLHRQVLGLDAYANIYKDPTLFPEFGASTPASMRAEAEAFVDEVIGSGGGVHELYTAPYTFANADLAPVYGASVAGSELQRIDLDPSERAGLLTLSGFLSMQADAYVHNPIRRGVFIAHEVLCLDLPPPPDDITPLPPPDGARTTRELVDGHTGTGTCGEGCHSTIINPPGFAFEQFDAFGRFRTEENGFAVDASGTWNFEGGARSWEDAVEFAAIVADSVEGHRCYTQHWLEYLHMRAVADQDEALLDSLAQTSRAEDRPITELMVDLLVADSFRFRSPEPLEVSE